MQIFFTASYSGRQKYQPYYDAIINTIKRTGNEIISLEVGTYADLLGNKRLKDLAADEIHHLYVRKGLAKAKAAVIDASESKFQLGYEATLALLLNKPILCVSCNEDFSKRIRHPKFYGKKYTSVEDLTTIVTDFLDEVKNKHLTVRFNGFLSPEQKNFLEWYGNKIGKNASEIIRDLIQNKIQQTPNYEEELTSLNSIKLRKQPL